MRQASRSARGPGVLAVAATGLASAAVAVDAGCDLPAPLRAVLFVGWLVAVGVLGGATVGCRNRRRAEALVVGGVAVGLFGLAVGLAPGGVRAVRLVPPWTAPPPTVRLTVTTPHPVVARGAGLTVACVREPLAPGPLPAVRLQVRDPDGRVRTVEPTEDPPGVFAARLPAVVAPLGFRFTAGPAGTDWHTATPADPVNLLTESVVETRPPADAAGQFPPGRSTPASPAVCLCGGTATAVVRFDRPPARVEAVWQPDDGGSPVPLAVELPPDRLTATTSAKVGEPGRFALTLVGDYGIRSRHVLPVAVVPDRPPAFVSVAGLEAGRWAVTPGEPLQLAVEVSDDLWAAAPTLELLTSADQSRPIPLTVQGGGRFAASLVVPPPARCRLRLTDRAHPGGVFFPPDGWAEHHPAAAAPLAEQHVAARRERVSAHLEAGGPHLAAAAVRHVEELAPLVARLDAAAPLPELRALNDRLAAEQLDRLRLGRLAADLRTVPTADAGRLRDRLAAVVAGSPRLRAARATADRQAAADAARAAGELADDLDRAAERELAARAEACRPLLPRVEPVAGRAGRLLAAGRIGDALPVLDAAGRRLAEQAAVAARTADARTDPREAARQLLAGRTAAPPAEQGLWDQCGRKLLDMVRPSDPSAARDLPTLLRDYPTPADVRRRTADNLRQAVRLIDTADPGAVTKAVDRLVTLPPAADSPASRLALAAARRTADGPAHDASAGLAEVRWRVELLIDQLLGGPDPLPPEPGERLAVLAGRIGLPPDAPRAAVRARLTGTDTEPERVAGIRRWWAGANGPAADRSRRLHALLATVRGGDEPATVFAARTANTPDELGRALDRLHADHRRRADRFPPLASLVPPGPLAAERLVALDAGGRLPTHRAAVEAAEAAREVAAIAGVLAARLAAAEADATTVTRREFVPAVGRLLPPLEQTPAGDPLRRVAGVLDGRATAVEAWVEAAAGLRLAACVVPTGEPVGWDELCVGRSLARADAELERATGGDAAAVRRAADEVLAAGR